MHNLQISANPSLYKSLPFNTVKDFAPVMLVNRNPLVLVGRPTLEAGNLRELIALMKKERLKAAIPDYGATGHLATTLFAQEAGVALDQIPYRGAAPAVTDLLGGQVDLFIATPQSVVQLVADGKLKAFGITAKEKLAGFPNVDSFVDVLGPKLDVIYWQALFVPGDTPAAVIRTLNSAAQQAVADPAIVRNWAAQDVTAFPPEQRTPGRRGSLSQKRDRPLGPGHPGQLSSSGAIAAARRVAAAGSILRQSFETPGRADHQQFLPRLGLPAHCRLLIERRQRMQPPPVAAIILT